MTKWQKLRCPDCGCQPIQIGPWCLACPKCWNGVFVKQEPGLTFQRAKQMLFRLWVERELRVEQQEAAFFADLEAEEAAWESASK